MFDMECNTYESKWVTEGRKTCLRWQPPPSFIFSMSSPPNPLYQTHLQPHSCMILFMILCMILCMILLYDTVYETENMSQDMSEEGVTSVFNQRMSQTLVQTKCTVLSVCMFVTTFLDVVVSDDGGDLWCRSTISMSQGIQFVWQKQVGSSSTPLVPPLLSSQMHSSSSSS